MITPPSAVDKIIRQAVRDGSFDNLPGSGKPLALEDNPLVDDTWRMAFHVLRSNGFTLPWIDIRKQIEIELENTRVELKRSWEWRCRKLDSNNQNDLVNAEWERSLESFKEVIEDLNNRIRNYNLLVPSTQFSRFLIDPDLEIARITGYSD